MGLLTRYTINSGQFVIVSALINFVMKSTSLPAVLPKELSFTDGHMNGLVSAESNGQVPSHVLEDRLERKKERIESVKAKILDLLGFKDVIPLLNNTEDELQSIFVPDVHSVIISSTTLSPVLATKDYVKTTQSFYPSCELPFKVDQEMWADPSRAFLNFEIPFFKSYLRSEVLSADLRIKLTSKYPDNTSFEDSKRSRLNAKKHRVRFSLYSYSKPIKWNREKKYLVDSKMIDFEDVTWLTFDAKHAVEEWLQSSKNFGLEIQAEDSEGLILNPTGMIEKMDCTKIYMNPLPVSVNYEHGNPNNLRDYFPLLSVDIQLFPRTSSISSKDDRVQVWRLDSSESYQSDASEINVSSDKSELSLPEPKSPQMYLPSHEFDDFTTRGEEIHKSTGSSCEIKRHKERIKRRRKSHKCRHGRRKQKSKQL